jgi:hypothetical protein
VTSRSIKSRVSKLEKSRKLTDEILVVWRRPGADVSEAVADVDYVSGDRVVCFEWYGDGPPPAPRWHKDLRSSLSKEENGSIKVILERILDAKPDRERSAEDEQRDKLLDYSSDDIHYILFGVPNGRLIQKL